MVEKWYLHLGFLILTWSRTCILLARRGSWAIFGQKDHRVDWEESYVWQRMVTSFEFHGKKGCFDWISPQIHQTLCKTA